MAQFNMLQLFRDALSGRVSPLMFVNVETRIDTPESARGYELTFHLGIEQLAHLPEGLRASLEKHAKEPLLISAVWSGQLRKLALFLPVVRFPKNPDLNMALQIVNTLNNKLGNIGTVAIRTTGDVTNALINASVFLPLPTCIEESKWILREAVMELSMEASDAATLLVAGLNRDPSAPTH